MNKRVTGMAAALSLSAATLLSDDTQTTMSRPKSDKQTEVAPTPGKESKKLTSLQKRYLERAEIYERQGQFPIMIKIYRQLAAGKPFEERLEETEVDGDPKVGVIVHIRMLHHNAFTGNADRLAQAYQQRMYEELKREDAKDIFYEGIWIDKEKEKESLIHKLRPEEMSQTVFFDKTKGGGLSLAEADALVAPFGAVPAYYMGYKGVTVHGIETELIDETYKKFKALDRGEIEYDDQTLKLIGQQRERIIAEVLMNFLKEHPGKTVTLVLGAAHELRDDIEAYEHPPVLKSVSFPRLLAEDAQQFGLEGTE